VFGIEGKDDSSKTEIDVLRNDIFVMAESENMMFPTAATRVTLR
jgi:hypothetical protein